MYKKVDFLFIYELRVRELENICLLRYELEKRGYSVAFINTWYYLNRKPQKYKAKVVLSFALYNDNVYKFLLTYVDRIDKLVNLQWEQYGTEIDEIEPSVFHLKGIAKQVVNVCWGQKVVDRIVEKCEIDKNKTLLSGHLSLDFFREEMIEYYKSKEEVLKLYNIPNDKKICLFISSFSFVDLPKDFVKNTESLIGNLDNFINLSVNSHKAIITWFENILKEDKNTNFIYRPHPAEARNESLIKLSDKYENFHIINDLSVKQWILISDIIYTWYSTTLAEIFYSKKKFFVLRPIEIPRELDLTIYKNIDYIKDYKTFKLSQIDNNMSTYINEEFFNDYYYVDKEEPTYIKICDKLETIYKDDNYKIKNLNNNQKRTLKDKYKTYMLRSKLNKVIVWLALNTKLKTPKFNRIRKKDSEGYFVYIKEMSLKNYATDKEITEIILRIKQVLDNKRKEEKNEKNFGNRC